MGIQAISWFCSRCISRAKPCELFLGLDVGGVIFNVWVAQDEDKKTSGIFGGLSYDNLIAQRVGRNGWRIGRFNP